MNAFSLGGVHLLLDAVDAAMATALKGLLCSSIILFLLHSHPILFCVVVSYLLLSDSTLSHFCRSSSTIFSIL